MSWFVREKRAEELIQRLLSYCVEESAPVHALNARDVLESAMEGSRE